MAAVLRAKKGQTHFKALFFFFLLISLKTEQENDQSQKAAPLKLSKTLTEKNNNNKHDGIMNVLEEMNKKKKTVTALITVFKDICKKKKN